MTQNRTAALAEALRGRIVEGRIAPGEKLPSESQLIAEHGVSRTVVREALGRLQAEGLIRTRRGAGSFALTPPPAPSSAERAPRPVRTLADRLALIDYRIALETQTAALAATRLGPQHSRRQGGPTVEALRAHAEAFAATAENPALAIQHDFALHRGIAEASGNPYLLDALEALGELMISMPRTRLQRPGPQGHEERHRLAAREHEQILDAVAAGDPQDAASAMRTHLANSRRRVLAKHS